MAKTEETSSWLSGIDFPAYPMLDSDIETDVAIIGAGITGITTAYLLGKSGKNVVLIDRKTPEFSTTAYTTAFITQEIDTDTTELVSMFGNKKTKQIWESHGAAIDQIEKIIKDEKISCEFIRCPAYIYANNEKEWKLLQEQAEIGKKLGFRISLHKDKKLTIPNFGYMTIANQAKFHPMKYISELITKAVNRKVRVFFNTEALNVVERKKLQIKTPKATITAKKVILATYLPLGNPIETFAKKGVYTTYLIEAKIEKNTIQEAIYWDMHNPYHYFRIDQRKDSDSIIIGGDDHRHEIPLDPEKQFMKLENYLQSILNNRQYKIVRRWNGPIVENIAVALIGKIHNNFYLATGFSGNGMTYGTIAAMMFYDSILGKKNQWDELYNPKQIPGVKQIGLKGFDYTEELVNELKTPAHTPTHLHK